MNVGLPGKRNAQVSGLTGFTVHNYTCIIQTGTLYMCIRRLLDARYDNTTDYQADV